MTFLHWVVLVALAVVTAGWVWFLLNPKGISTFKIRQIRKSTDLAREAVEYAEKGMWKNAEVCMRSSDEEFAKGLGIKTTARLKGE